MDVDSDAYENWGDYIAARRALLAEHFIGRECTVAQWDSWVEEGVFITEDPVELIRGVIVQKSERSFRHNWCRMKLNHQLLATIGDQASVWPGGALHIGDHSEPEPDYMVLKCVDCFELKTWPPGTEPWLMVEVADESLNFDKGVKVPLYAEAGVPVVWLVNLIRDVVEVYSRPTGLAYKDVREVFRGEMLSLPAGLDGVIAVDELLGNRDNDVL